MTRATIAWMELSDVRSLLDAGSPAALATYRRDGSVDVSPVWFRFTDTAFEMVIAEGDPKLRHLERDPRAVLTVFETVAPFRGVKVGAEAELDRDAARVREARLAIAPRYVGPVRAPAYVEARGPGAVVRLPSAPARVWDLSSTLPDL
jgi:PPOX class probable F420-dependent enzyme